MPSQDLTTRVAVFPANSTLTGIVHIGNMRVVRIRPSSWAPGTLSFNVGPVYDSLGTIQTGVGGAAFTITPTKDVESMIAPADGLCLGPWLQLASAVEQTTAANVLITLDPR